LHRVLVEITVPKVLLDAIRRRGLGPEALILEAIAERLSRDPREEPCARLAAAEHMLRRAREELKQDDPVQASEKLYKAVEGCIRILACLEGLDECTKAREEGRWWTRLLARAARQLRRRLGENIVLEAWSQGYDLHVHGFHEHALSVKDVEVSLPIIEKLVDYTRHQLESAKKHKESQHN